MTAYPQRQIQGAAHVGTGPSAPDRGSATPRGSLAIGRYMGTVIVSLHGDLSVSASVRLAAVLRDLIDSQGNLSVVVDLADVGGIDRSGLDVLASAGARMDKRGGALRLAGPTGAVVDALILAGSARLIRSPLDQPHGPTALTRRASATLRASKNAHPAGSHRHDLEVRGDAP